MTGGEKMIWAAGFVAAIYDNDPLAVERAYDRVEDARRTLARNAGRIRGRPALEMLRDLLEGSEANQ